MRSIVTMILTLSVVIEVTSFAQVAIANAEIPATRPDLGVTLLNFDKFSSFRRLKTYEITWTGNTAGTLLHFDLYKGDSIANTFPGVSNVGHYNLVFPKSTLPGKDYWFRITVSGNPGEVIETEKFSIKRKTPLALKALPAVAIGIAVIVVSNGKSGSEKGIPDPVVPQ
jgi:hypothetical protein